MNVPQAVLLTLLEADNHMEVAAMSEYRLIPLSGKNGKGKFAKVSPEDYERVMQYKWWVYPAGYAYTRTKVSTGILHRAMHTFIIYGRGAFPVGTEIDHAKNDRLDNRRDKLRVCSRSQNAQNSTPRKDGTSKYKGVHWHSQTGKWAAKIQVENVCYHLGCFVSEEQAAQVYDACARYYHGEFCKTNFATGEIFDYQTAQARGREAKGVSSVFRGVVWEKRREYWYVEISKRKAGKRVRLCYKRFSEELEAARFYDNFVKENDLKKPLNFP